MYIPVPQALVLDKNIPRIGKLPYGAKRCFIERKDLLKEMLNEEEKNWSTFGNFNKIWKFC